VCLTREATSPEHVLCYLLLRCHIEMWRRRDEKLGDGVAFVRVCNVYGIMARTQLKKYPPMSQQVTTWGRMCTPRLWRLWRVLSQLGNTMQTLALQFVVAFFVGVGVGVGVGVAYSKHNSVVGEPDALN
jgi:ABC-type nitrate/sulfonate/bicarbonate transport system permease component